MVFLYTPADAETKPIVSGAGSTWSQIAVDQWRADVSRFGLRINYQGVGSSAGRSFYINEQVDFAVSEIPFEDQEIDALKAKGREWAYLPIVAGGTSFMYNIRDGSGQPITTLRLSSATVTGIFTGKITKWNDPAITSENPGTTMPDLDIIPVVRSDGSGTTAQFTAYMAKMERDAWCEFAQKNSMACSYTSNYPNFSGAVSQSGSDGVANYVHSESTGQGAITYVETGYALQRGRPVAFMKNGSGGYALPTSSNVSTALKKATLNADRTQNLDDVYTNADASAYPLSSYSYMIVPTKGLDEAKGDVMGSFMIYFACDGQRKADQLGYAPLPQNLVEVVFDAVNLVPGAPDPPPISECKNPTITGSDGGGTSDDTAAALSGGESTSGTAPATPGADSNAGGAGGGTAATEGATGGGGGTTAGGTTIGEGATSSGGDTGATSSTAGGSSGTGGSSSAGGGSSGSLGTGTQYGGVDGALSPQALEQVQAGATSDSSGPLMAAGLAVALLVFGPPLLTSLRDPRQRYGG